MGQIVFFGHRSCIRGIEKTKLRLTIQKIAQDHKHTIGRIAYILVDDDALHKINIDYLSHDTFTDIITFDLSETPLRLDSEIYISSTRVIENGEKHGSVEDEFLRVFFHGILHLCGYKDKTKEQQQQMRKKENHYITLYRET